MTTKQCVALLLPLLLFLLITCLLVYNPTERLKNILFPTFLRDPIDGKVYRLVVYWGNDKNSSVVAEIRPMSESYTIFAGNWYHDLEKIGAVKSIQSTRKYNKPYLKLIKK
jgi:hypothetical protein